VDLAGFPHLGIREAPGKEANEKWLRARLYLG